MGGTQLGKQQASRWTRHPRARRRWMFVPKLQAHPMACTPTYHNCRCVSPRGIVTLVALHQHHDNIVKLWLKHCLWVVGGWGLVVWQESMAWDSRIEHGVHCSRSLSGETCFLLTAQDIRNEMRGFGGRPGEAGGR